MSKPIEMKNDFGTVVLDDKARIAIAAVQAMADELHMTPAEFIAEFDNGIPSCPCCDYPKHDYEYQHYCDYKDYCAMNGLEPKPFDIWRKL